MNECEKRIGAKMDSYEQIKKQRKKKIFLKSTSDLFHENKKKEKSKREHHHRVWYRTKQEKQFSRATIR